MLVLFLLTNLDWNGVKDILFSKYFHVRRIHPSHHPNRFWACSDGMTTLHLTLVFFLSIFYLAVSSSLGNKTVSGSDRSCISSASFGIQII